MNSLGYKEKRKRIDEVEALTDCTWNKTSLAVKSHCKTNAFIWSCFWDPEMFDLSTDPWIDVPKIPIDSLPHLKCNIDILYMALTTDFPSVLVSVRDMLHFIQVKNHYNFGFYI